MRKELKPITEILKEWQKKGVEEIYGFNGRHGMVFKSLQNELDCYEDESEKILGYVTPKGYVVETDGYRLGQLVHSKFGWE